MHEIPHVPLKCDQENIKLQETYSHAKLIDNMRIGNKINKGDLQFTSPCRTI